MHTDKCAPLAQFQTLRDTIPALGEIDIVGRCDSAADSLRIVAHAVALRAEIENANPLSHRRQSGNCARVRSLEIGHGLDGARQRIIRVGTHLGAYKAVG